MNSVPTSITRRSDVAGIGSALRRYAFFEGETPSTPATPVTPTGTNGENAGGKTFTQEQVEAMVKDRLERQAGSERKKLMTELGIEDPAADAELLKAARAKREADKTEVERAASDAAKEKKRADELQAELDQERTQRRIENRDRRIVAQAATLKAIVPDDVLAWASLNAADALAKTLKDDGTVDEKAVEALVKACQTARPAWFGRAGVGTQTNKDGRVINPDDRNKQTLQRRLEQRTRTLF